MMLSVHGGVDVDDDDVLDQFCFKRNPKMMISMIKTLTEVGRSKVPPDERLRSDRSIVSPANSQFFK